MSNFTDHFDESARVTVAEEDCVSGWSVGLVIFGICLTLPSLYTGALTAENLGIVGSMKAVGLASLVLSMMSIPAAIVGARTRLTSYLIIEFVFGRRGSNYVNSLLALTLLGWFAVTAGFFGETLHIAFIEMLGASPPVWSLTLVSSAIILFTTIFGYKAIDRLSLLAVPLLILFLLYVSMLSLRVESLGNLLEIPAKNPDYFSTAVSAIIGSLIVGVVLMPDLSRYARTTKDCIAASVLGNGIGNSFSMLIAVLPAMVTGLLDPMAFMIALGLLGSAFVILVFATWTTNSINLYSTTLAAAIIVPKTPEWKLGVVCGIIGTGLAMLGITEHFVDLLIWLGVIVPPIAGIYLTDFFILKRQDYDLKTLEKVSNYEKAPLAAWILATALSAASFSLELSFSSIPSLDALLITIPIYLLSQRLMPPAYNRIKEAN